MPTYSTIALTLSMLLAALAPAAPASASAPDAGLVDADDAGASDASTPAQRDAGSPPPLAADPPPKLRGEVSACSVGGGNASAADLGVLMIALAALLRRRSRT